MPVTLDVMDVMRMLVAAVRGDSALIAVMRPSVDDPRIYPYYLPTATVDSTHKAYITYAETAFPEQVKAVREPIFNLAIWAIDWETVMVVRDRLELLFDGETRRRAGLVALLTTPGGRVLFGTRIMEHNNYQENTKFSSQVVQFRFGASKV